jgi:hypothetical protein
LARVSSHRVICIIKKRSKKEKNIWEAETGVKRGLEKRVDANDLYLMKYSISAGLGAI